VEETTPAAVSPPASDEEKRKHRFLPPLQRGKWLRRPKQRFGLLQTMGARATPASICSLFVFGDFGDVRRCKSIA
jgi:hypothetical protein